MADKQSHQFPRGGYKSWFDMTVLILAHLLLLPLWLLLWIVIPVIIWLGDRGPVFYKQDRVGKDGRVFTVRKFRTMVPDAYHKGPAWTVPGDARLTRIGKILRRTAMDELPELWSILKGDMSLVGPRALDVDEHKILEQQIPGFRARLCVKPGLTGLAQIYDSADRAQDKLAYDLDYVERMCLWLDMKLLVLSVRNTLGVKWDRRSGKTSEANGFSGPPSKGVRQQETAGEGHVGNVGELIEDGRPDKSGRPF